MPQDLYTPTIFQALRPLALIGVHTDQCPICKKIMLKSPTKELQKYESIYGSYTYGGNTLLAQCQRAGFVLISDRTDKENNLICNECADSGKGTFICFNCKKELTSDLIQQSYGFPPDRLCKNCYETVCAKTWDELDKKLNEMHQYDWD